LARPPHKAPQLALTNLPGLLNPISHIEVLVTTHFHILHHSWCIRPSYLASSLKSSSGTITLWKVSNRPGINAILLLNYLLARIKNAVL